MSFGRNPYVAKAEAEELKAEVAKDDRAREQAFREAARQWDRAADREADAGRRAMYVAKAEAAREKANHPTADDETIETVDDLVAGASKIPRELLN